MRGYLRDNNSIRVSRSIRDIAYKALQARELLTTKNNREPTIDEVAKEIGIPKEDIANALHVNVETLTGADFDGVKAMHRLFQIFRQYPGELIEYKDSEGADRLAVSFNGLMLMSSWFERYEMYQKEIEGCNKI